MTEFKRTSQAEWKGDIRGGMGKVTLGSGAFSGPYSFNSRFGTDAATNPEELIAAAHAGCYAMALSGALTTAGHPPARISAKSDVTIAKDDPGFTISGIKLSVEAEVPGMSEADFTRIAAEAAKTCPVSRALSSVPMTHDAKLVAGPVTA